MAQTTKAAPKTGAPDADAAPALPPALRDRFFVVDNFLPIELAEAMRLDIDKRRPSDHDVIGWLWRATDPEGRQAVR